MRKRQSLSLRRRLCNGGAAAALWVSALLCCALLLFLTGYIFYRGLPGISWDFLTGAESILQGTAGILPAIVNTLYVLLLSLAIALPLGAGNTLFALGSSLLNCIVVRVVLALLFNHYFGLVGIFWACAIAPASSVPLGYLYERSGVWRKSLVEEN